MRVTRKIFTRVAAFFLNVYISGTILTALFFVEKQGVLPFIYLFIYLLYLTLVYKIVKNNSTNKYQQNQVKI